jgi:hypothetical protein
VTMKSKHAELLQCLRKNNKWSLSVSLQATVRHSSTINDNVTTTHATLIRDHDRCQWKGEGVLRTAENVILEEASHVRFVVMNGDKYLTAIGPDLDSLWRGYIKEADYEAIRVGMLNDPSLAGALSGRMFGSHGMDIYGLIEQSQDIRYGESDVSMDGLACYEIEGTCKYGKTRIIFSPDKGYCPLKWEITKIPGHYFHDKLLGQNTKNWKATYYADEIKEIGGFYIPLKGHLQHEEILADGHG